jgi:hypothetical protein
MICTDLPTLAVLDRVSHKSTVESRELVKKVLSFGFMLIEHTLYRREAMCQRLAKPRILKDAPLLVGMALEIVQVLVLLDRMKPNVVVLLRGSVYDDSLLMRCGNMIYAVFARRDGMFKSVTIRQRLL